MKPLLASSPIPMGHFVDSVASPQRLNEYDLIESLVSQHRYQKALIERVSELMAGSGYHEILGYFLAGADGELALRMRATPELFDAVAAVKALDAEYWNRALNLTDVRVFMPSARQKEWDAQITNRECLPFEKQAVQDTLRSLLASRSRFLAEQVDGVFHALSPNHVSNSPAGFGKRMILEYARCKATGNPESEKTRLIADLRYVIAMLMGRDRTVGSNPRAMSYGCNNPGKWILLDGGALRVRFHLTGTVHVEIHPEMVWQLNQILASLYPNAIPDKFRRPIKKQTVHKDWPLMEIPLSFGALAIVAKLKRQSIKPTGVYTLDVSRFEMKFMPEAEMIIQAIGGAKVDYQEYAFPYSEVNEVVDLVVSLGRLPEQKTHQFYGTGETLAKEVVSIADIRPDETVCEPSAGQAGIAQYLPASRTTCVEVSEVNCGILRRFDFNLVIQADFLTWALKASPFDIVVMNPPYSSGRALAHLESASLIARRRIVAILPASLHGKDILPGWEHQWSKVYEGEFKGTGAAVAILRADRVAH